MSTRTSTTDTRNPVAYVPKPTHSPNVAVQQTNDNGARNSNSDTRMHDATAEEEKKCSNPDKTIIHTGDTKKVTWAK